jgi:hypothetical protein
LPDSGSSLEQNVTGYLRSVGLEMLAVVVNSQLRRRLPCPDQAKSGRCLQQLTRLQTVVRNANL